MLGVSKGGEFNELRNPTWSTISEVPLDAAVAEQGSALALADE